MTAIEGTRNSQVSTRHSDAYWDIGFTDNSNPFYLFLKMNEGLLLLAPSALRCDKSIPS
jgi:hypothetical protein